MSCEKACGTCASIRSATLQLVGDRGLSGVSLDALVDRTKLTPAQVRSHYPTVQACVSDTYEQVSMDLLGDDGRLVRPQQELVGCAHQRGGQGAQAARAPPRRGAAGVRRGAARRPRAAVAAGEHAPSDGRAADRRAQQPQRHRAALDDAARAARRRQLPSDLLARGKTARSTSCPSSARSSQSSRGCSSQSRHSPRGPGRSTSLRAMSATTATTELESFNPATGERHRRRRDHRARGRSGGGGRRREGAAVLGPAEPGGPRPLPRARRSGADRRGRRDPRPARARAGQAAQRGVLDGDPADDRRAAAGSRTPARRSSPTRRSRCRSCS